MGLNTPTSARFVSHQADLDQVRRMAAVRDGCGALATEILASCTDCRERALALTKLEEVMFWANAGIAREKVSVAPARPHEEVGRRRAIDEGNVP